MSEQKPMRPRYAVIPEGEVQSFRTLGHETFGAGWIYRLAQFAGVSTRTAQRWAAGEATIPGKVLEDLQREHRRLHRHGFKKDLQVLAAKMLGEGVSPHVVAAQFKDMAAQVKPEKESTAKD